jgi:NADH:ubiquinone oxidoreductase subunit 3 (subunit A)
MFNLSILFFFQSVLLVTLIFWALSVIGEKFFKSNTQETSQELFECGFLVVTSLRLRFNFNFFILGILLLLYDVEFFILIPFFFNMYVGNFVSICFFWWFYALILLSFSYDWQNTAFTTWAD